MLIFSGMTMMQRYPLTAAARARPIPEKRGKSHKFANLQQPGSFKTEWGHIPVFPEVGSMMVSPGLRVPARSASSIIRRLILSFTLPPALKNSHLATANTSQTEALWLLTFQSRKAVKTHQTTARRLTNFTLESKCFGDLVDAHHGSVPDLVQDIWENERRTGSGQGSWAKADYLCWYSYYNCVLYLTRVHTKPETRVLLWNLKVWGISCRGSQAPCAAAGKVGPDPFSLCGGILCAQLNGFVRILCIGQRGHLVDPVGVEQLAGVRAHWAIHWILFGRGNRWHGLPWRKECNYCGTFFFPQ